jgi:outer membrane receptor protein involved in Fe transport
MAQNDGSSSAADPWGDVEEMVVVGTSNAAMLLRSTTAVTSFGAAELADKGISDIQGLGTFTPNLEIKTAGSTTPALFIRGVGLNSFDANASGAVAVYRDGAALNLPGFQGGQLFDLEGIDVLKGPQGSGPGRNASAGAIVIRSKKPTGDFNAYLRADYGNYGYTEVEGAVGMPIIPDLVSARISFKVRDREGTVTNRCGNLPPFNPDDPSDPINLNRVIDRTRGAQSQCGEAIGNALQIPNPFSSRPRSFRLSQIEAGLEKDLNNLSDWAIRGQLRFQPDYLDQDWTLNIHGSQIDQLGTVGQPVGTSEGYLGSTTAAQNYIEPEIRAEYERLLDAEGILGINTTVCRNDPVCAAAAQRAQDRLGSNLASGRPLDLDPFTGAYNVPGYEKQKTWGIVLNGELELGPIHLTTVTGFERYTRKRLTDFDFTPSTIFEFESEDDAWQFTQDIQLEHEFEATPLIVRAGAYAIVEELDFQNRTIAGGDVRPLFQVFNQSTYGAAAFTEFEWDFMDDFELKAGVRVNWEKKEFEVEDIRVTPTINVCVDGIGGNPNNTPSCKTAATFLATTGVVALTYDFNSEVSSFIKYTRGWKGPQFNISNGASRDTLSLAKPESIDSVEFGVSGEWFDGRISANANFFFYRYENYQVFLFTNDFSSPPQRIVQNANAARLYGADGEISVEPIELLTFKMGFSWLESAFLDFKDSGIRRIIIGPNEPPRIAEVPIDFTGNRLPNTPRFKITGTIKYRMEFNFGSLTPVYNVVFTDDTFFDPSNGRGAPNNQGDIFLPDFTIGQKALMLHDFRLTYATPEETMSAAFWIRNLTNEVYKQVGFDATSTAGLVGNFLGDPRTYGLSVRFAY